MEDLLFERALQYYLELRVRKRPPEGVAGATRKTLRWFWQEAVRAGRDYPGSVEEDLHRALLDVEGDVIETLARRRWARR